MFQEGPRGKQCAKRSPSAASMHKRFAPPLVLRPRCGYRADMLAKVGISGRRVRGAPLTGLGVCNMPGGVPLRSVSTLQQACAPHRARPRQAPPNALDRAWSSFPGPEVHLGRARNFGEVFNLNHQTKNLGNRRLGRGGLPGVWVGNSLLPLGHFALQAGCEWLGPSAMCR